MKNLIRKTMRGLLLAGGLALAGLLTVQPAAAATWNLTASAVPLTMPDGNVVTMWGLAQGANLPFDPIIGVPVLRETAGATMTINLTNNLPVVTSLVIPGQDDTTMTPVFFLDLQGRQRAQSFTHETAAGGGGSYTWGNLAAGTYLIHSGTHAGVQVPMGLYAVLVVDGGGYPAVDQDVVLLFSEVDSLQHLAVAGFAGDPLAVPPLPAIAPTYGTAAYPTTMAAGYEADYYLLNGRPWGPDRTAFPAGALASTTLLRFLNAGIRDRVPVLEGGLMTVLAEDGNLLPTGNLQHSVELPPMKTMDATFTAAVDGYYPVYDRRLGLSNNNSGPGGMLTYLQVGTPAQTLTAAIAGTSTGTGSVRMSSAPGGIDLANFVGGGIDNSESLLTGTAVTLSGVPQPGTGSVLTGWTVAGGDGTECLFPFGDCVVTMDAGKTVTATFSTFTQVTLLAPNGAEAIPSGSGLTIYWGAPVGAVNFTLAYSFGPGTPWQTIAAGVTGNSYVWGVPDNLPDYGSLYIAVIAYDAAGTQIGMDFIDASANRFSIALITPSAIDIVLTNGALYDITWSSSLVSGVVANTGIWYQTAPGQPWQLISVVAGNPGLYTWTVPNTPTATARVGVIFYDAAGTSLHMDVSDNTFTIQ
jgi:FtsP/CotA-like multicopper oxidase with cupredoxin domain